MPKDYLSENAKKSAEEVIEQSQNNLKELLTNPDDMEKKSWQTALDANRDAAKAAASKLIGK